MIHRALSLSCLITKVFIHTVSVDCERRRGTSAEILMGESSLRVLGPAIRKSFSESISAILTPGRAKHSQTHTAGVSAVSNEGAASVSFMGSQSDLAIRCREVEVHLVAFGEDCEC
jgi:hypothetical protein